MCREDFPKHGCPFKENVSDVKRVKYPSPLRGVEIEIMLCPGGFGVANITTVEIGEDIETADDGQDSAIELYTSVSSLLSSARLDFPHRLSDPTICSIWNENAMASIHRRLLNVGGLGVIADHYCV